MCNLCNRDYGHICGCPNAPEAPSIGEECEYCENPIRVGEDYNDDENGCYFHTKCAHERIDRMKKRASVGDVRDKYDFFGET